MSIPEDKMEKIHQKTDQFAEEIMKIAEKYLGPYGTERRENLRQYIKADVIKEQVYFYQKNPEKLIDL